MLGLGRLGHLLDNHPHISSMIAPTAAASQDWSFALADRQ
ncbi:hypothetical protein AO379_1773 [Moraxella catarrhalis]|nr:hypothetical protein AO379_1773 [Moraxella catarrhalis]